MPIDLFPTRKELEYSGFQTYHLRPIDPEEDVRGYDLPRSGATARVTERTLGWRETRARKALNHLATQGSTGVYVDAEWNIVGFELNDDLEPTFTTLVKLSKPESEGELPRALPLSDDNWAVSTGSGQLYILQARKGVIARYNYPAAFQLEAAHATDAAWHVLLTRPLRRTVGERTRTTYEMFEAILTKAPNGGDQFPGLLVPAWTLEGADLPYWCEWRDGWMVLCEEPFGGPGEVKRSKKRKREERKSDRRGLGVRGDYLQMEDDYGEDEAEELEAERVANEKPDEEDNIRLQDEGDLPTLDEKTDPYHWTQSDSTITLTVPLPWGTTKKDISIGISTLSVRFSLPPSCPVKGSQQLWADIDARSSKWTVDEATSTLTLMLVKALKPSKWMTVFLPTSPSSSSSPRDVPESFEPVDVDKLRTALKAAKDERKAGKTENPTTGRLLGITPKKPKPFVHTKTAETDDDADTSTPRRSLPASVKRGKLSPSKEVTPSKKAEASPLKDTTPSKRAFPSTPSKDEDDVVGTSPIAKSLLSSLRKAKTTPSTHSPFARLSPASPSDREPISRASEDDSDDDDEEPPASGVGRPCLVGHINLAGHASWSSSAADVLSLPLGSSSGIIKKAGTNGYHFTPPPAPSDVLSPWTHTSTTPALGFVMTAKPDMRFVRHLNGAVLAFDPGSGLGVGNVYAYYPVDVGADEGRQGVVGVSGGDRGSLLGVGVVCVGNGADDVAREVVVALTERELVVLGHKVISGSEVDVV